MTLRKHFQTSCHDQCLKRLTKTKRASIPFDVNTNVVCLM